ncbi:MAG TPA: prolyl oligopeptidase family serine peptidase [Nocardioidaceae bacterium]|nr:prolyl oligopeptidase family serine peptidase [Nocardioidaceae bacterium]
MGAAAAGKPKPPVARREPEVRELHGVRRIDDYAWLRDLHEPGVLAHLQAERDFFDAATLHLRPLATTLANEMSSRLLPTDASVSWRLDKFSYYTRTSSGSEYTELCRTFHNFDSYAATISVANASQDDDSPTHHTVLLDVAALAEGSSYVELGVCAVSPDERLLAYSFDRSGDEFYALHFRDLDTGEDLPDVLVRTYSEGAWSADSRTFFYTVYDEKYRPFQLWRHQVGADVSSDALVLEETDERFDLSVRRARSGDLLFIGADSRDTSEVWMVDAHAPEQAATIVEPRRRGVQYSCEHVRAADGARLFLVTNDGATEFRLLSSPVESPGRGSWEPVVAEQPGRRLLSVDAFENHLVLTLRDVESQFLQVLTLDTGASYELRPEAATGTIRLDHNELYDVSEITVAQESHTEPMSWHSVDLASGKRRLLGRRAVPSYNPADYVSERRFLPGSDTVPVPVTVVRRRDVTLDGTAPCLLYGYGAYEAIFEPEFDPALTVLLDRGVVFAHAHVRGGGEGGRPWWLDGRLSAKQNTFSDYIAVADGLADGVVDAARIVTRGLSAGGLLQGAVFSQAPARWAGVVAEVPFVDVVTTMLDASIPLTANEWDEWGDPRRAEEFAWLLAYSPYDNLPPAGDRPPLLVTGALHDARVMVWEPAKWVAALRASDSAWGQQCLFRCETGTGAHVGPSGRFARLRYEAELYAWVLERFELAGAL